MVRRHLLYLLYTSSARPPSSPPHFTAPPPPLVFRKGYGHTGEPINHERAPSTLEEFKRLEEEKEKVGQRVARPVVENGKDGVKEAADVVGNPTNTGDSQATK